MNGLTKPRPSNTEPRKRNSPTKAERRLARRQSGFKNEGKTEMHMPGSQNLRNKG